MAKVEDFATRMRLARVRRELNQHALAVKTGLQPSAISQFETGQRVPSLENLRKLATALEVSTDFLINGDQLTSASGPQISAVVRYAAIMADEDLDILEGFAELLAKKAAKKIR